VSREDRSIRNAKKGRRPAPARHSDTENGNQQQRDLSRGTSSRGKGENRSVLWQKRHEHYTALARAAALKGNSVDAEYNYQHAEHYLRMLRGSAA